MRCFRCRREKAEQAFLQPRHFLLQMAIAPPQLLNGDVRHSLCRVDRRERRRNRGDGTATSPIFITAVTTSLFSPAIFVVVGGCVVQTARARGAAATAAAVVNSAAIIVALSTAEQAGGALSTASAS